LIREYKQLTTYQLNIDLLGDSRRKKSGPGSSRLRVHFGTCLSSR